MKERSVVRAGLVLAVSVALAGCTGEIQTLMLDAPEDSVQRADMSGSVPDGVEGMDAGVVISPDGGVTVRPDAGGESETPPSGPVTMPIRHITPLQYEHMIADLFGDRIAPELFDDADKNAAASGYSTEPSANVVTGRGVRQLFDSAEVVALESVDIMTELLPCSANPVDEACFDELLERYVARAFRRPLVAAERSLMSEVYDEARADGFSEHEALAVVLQTMLQMPQFLYVTEVGVPRASDPNVLDLTDHEIAQRLALFFLDSLPDDELRRAADAGELHTPEQIEAQARRLLRDYPDASILERLLKEWLHLDDVLSKDRDAFPEFDQELERSIREETGRVFAQAITSGDTLDDLLNIRRVPMNQALADFYGVQSFAPGRDGWAMTDLPADHQGLLARPYFLGSHASSAESSHVQRGYTVLKQFLCSPTGSIPPDAMSRVPVYPQNSTSRQKSDVLRQEVACGACHEMIDHIGLSFEHYDAVGSWRDRAPASQGGQALDVSGRIATVGTVADTDIAGETFTGVDGLTALLSGSDSVQACIPRQWFRYAIGRVEADEADERVILELTEDFARTDGSLQELLISITQVEAFRTRALSQ